MPFPSVDYLVVGGGIIGLSLARELAGRGQSVRVIDRATPAREASWAGAGMIPPAPIEGNFDAWTLLRGRGAALQEAISRELREETGVYDGYRRCGAVYLAFDESSVTDQQRSLAALASGGVEVQNLDPQELATYEPRAGWETARSSPLLASLLPSEGQIRNPWRLAALTASCERRGVEIASGVEALAVQLSGDRAVAVRTTLGPMSCGSVCFAAGAWTGKLLQTVGWERPPVRPVRGQIALLRWPSARLSRNINVGPRYLTPRADGRCLVGSTEEEAGFHKTTTAEAIGSLLRFAQDVCPATGDAAVEQTWAGLRPATESGRPLMGRLPEQTNLFVAAGHFRAGLTASPAVARVMAELICGDPPSLDLGELDPALGFFAGRTATSAAAGPRA